MNKIEMNFNVSFKFYVKDYHRVIYTCNAGDKDSNCKIVWTGNHGTTTSFVDVEDARSYIRTGLWIVLPSQPEEILTCEKSTWQYIQDALIHSDGRISVEVFKESYTINHMSLTQCFDKVEEEDLGRLLDALVVLDEYEYR